MTHQFFIQVNFCFKFLGAFKTFVLFLYVPFECNLIIWHRTLGINFMKFHCCVTMLHTNKNKNYFNDCKLWRSVLYSFFLSVIIFYNNYKSLHHQIFCKTLPVVYAWPSYLYTEARAEKLYKSIKKHFSFEISLLFKIDSVLSEKKSKMFRLNSKFTNDRQRIIYEHRNQ